MMDCMLIDNKMLPENRLPVARLLKPELSVAGLSAFRSLLVWALVVLPVLLISQPAAAIMLPADMDRLVEGSESVISGRVVSLDMHWLNGPNSIIVTEVGFAVDEVWMGSQQQSGDSISVRIIGGTVGEIGMWQEHQPTFEMDDEAVLFLRLRTDGELGVAFSEQGVYLRSDEQLSGHLRELKTVSEFRMSLESSKQYHGRQ